MNARAATIAPSHKFSRAYLWEIDCVRGILSLIVLFAHIFDVFVPLRENPFEWAWGCMEMFFAVSGYLIARNFISKYKESVVSDYFVNRALRIWPLYYTAWIIALIVTVTVRVRYYQGSVEPVALATGFAAYGPAVFLQNIELYWGDSLSSVFLFNHSWSVALEEQFYFVVAPLGFLIFRRHSYAFIFCLAVLLLGFTATFRYYGLHQWTLAGRLDGFVLGLLLAFTQALAGKGHRVAAALSRRSTYAGALLVSTAGVAAYIAECYGWSGEAYLIYSMYVQPVANPHFTFALFSVSSLGLITTAPERVPKYASLGWLAVLGRISYSTYLLHVPLVYALVPALLETAGWAPYWIFIWAPIITLCVAYVSYLAIERPFLKLKRYNSGRSITVQNGCSHGSVAAQ